MSFTVCVFVRSTKTELLGRPCPGLVQTLVVDMQTIDMLTDVQEDIADIANIAALMLAAFPEELSMKGQCQGEGAHSTR